MHGTGAAHIFRGSITFSNGANLRTVAKSVPVERLLLETDCPFLSPPTETWRTERAVLFILRYPGFGRYLWVIDKRYRENHDLKRPETLWYRRGRAGWNGCIFHTKFIIHKSHQPVFLYVFFLHEGKLSRR